MPAALISSTPSGIRQVRDDIELIVGLLPGKDKRAARSRAILTFSALVGAMSLARAVSDESLSREIQNTVAELLKKSASGHNESKTRRRQNTTPFVTITFLNSFS